MIRGLSLVWQFVGPIAFLLVMLLFSPFSQRFEFDTDEGINLMKAMLVAEGHPLYEEVWNDQPPLFTYALVIAFRVFGFNVSVGRVFVLILSCLLLWGSWRFLQIVGGNIYAFAGVFFIVLLPHYSQLSISVMVGLPALALAMVSLLSLAIWHERRTDTWLVISAITLSLSVLIKIFTGFLALIFILGITITELSRPKKVAWRKQLRPVILWALAFVSVTIALGLLLIGSHNLSQLLETHLAAREAPIFPGNAEYFSINSVLHNTQPTMFLALLGSLLVIRYQRWLVLYLIAWSGIAYLLLSYHFPVWYHHSLLMTIPAAMLAACTLGEVGHWLKDFYLSRNVSIGRGLIMVIVTIGAILIVTSQVSSIRKLLSIRSLFIDSRVPVSSPQYQLVDNMIQHAPQTQWVITDQPMYAFRANLLVPPHLAVISRKRIVTGNLTEQEILNSIHKWEPEQVFLTRFEWPLIENYLEENYRVVFSYSEKKLYLRNDLE